MTPFAIFYVIAAHIVVVVLAVNLDSWKSNWKTTRRWLLGVLVISLVISPFLANEDEKIYMIIAWGCVAAAFVLYPTIMGIRFLVQENKLTNKTLEANESSRFGFGYVLIGKQIDGEFGHKDLGIGLYSSSTYRKYLFLTLFYIPIYPKRCYKVLSYYQQDGPNIYCQERILSAEKIKTGEVIHIYIFRTIMSLPFFFLYPVVASMDEKNHR